MCKKVIGICGVARSGKDSFCNLACEILKKEYGLIGTRYALADALKDDMRDFLFDKVGIDVYTTDDDEKKIIRPLLVEYGRCKRIQTKARYWTSKVEKQIRDDEFSDIAFVTDVRYAEYELDELQWIRKSMGGKLVHVSRYDLNEFNEKVFIKPPNIDEERNDPILWQHADVKFQWKNVTKNDEPDWGYMKSEIKNIIKTLID
jgi:hypothetical protein